MAAVSRTDICRVKSGAVSFLASVVTLSLFVLAVVGEDEFFPILRMAYGHVCVMFLASGVFGMVAGSKKTWVGGLVGTLVTLGYCIGYLFYLVASI